MTQESVEYRVTSVEALSAERIGHSARSIALRQKDCMIVTNIPREKIFHRCAKWPCRLCWVLYFRDLF